MNPQEILHHYWGHKSFRPAQEEIIRAVLNKRDTLAILPTGGGKSVCFQVPALCMPGCCLVISPLIALMEDQVQRLNKMGIPSAAIKSGMTWQESSDILNVCVNDGLKFLYISPERLETKGFRDQLRHLPLNLLAIDESHCISQWGYDFRPAYLQIAQVRKTFPDIPVLALTASATPAVQSDIIRQLKMRDPLKFTTSFTRKNLVYEVVLSNTKIVNIVQNLEFTEGSGIVYCKSRRRTKEISDLLQQHGINSDFYHAGLDQLTRRKKQEDWINNETSWIVCTNAFGMGIDKPDVRMVLHADVPDSLENYYQEAGRAGRDGNPAKAILFFNEHELAELKLQPEIRYPPMATIRKIYHAMANYLQVPTGGGVNVSYDFNLEEFIQRFKLNQYEVLYSLQTLKQEQIISYHENVFIPATVQFTASRTFIEEMENLFPAHEPLIKALLRTYAGILDFPVKINEQQLSRKLRKEVTVIKNNLWFLHQQGLLQYTPLKDQPQINFLQGRVKTEELNINHAHYLNRKKAFQSRVEKMIAYIKDDECRSVSIGSYFGDDTIVTCGICDNCRKKKKRPVRSGVMEDIIYAISEELKESMDLNKLHYTLGIEIDLLNKALHYMKNEGIIYIDQKGLICLK